MKTKLAIALLVGLLLTGAWLLLRDRDPLPPPPGVDSCGDPLPPWAVARIGRFVAAPVHEPLVFFADGETLTAAIGDGEVGVVEVATGRVQSRTRVYEAHPGIVQVRDQSLLGGLLPSEPVVPISRVSAISSDGQLALVTTHGSAKVVTIETGEVLREVVAHEISMAGFTLDDSGVVITGGLPPIPGALSRGGEVRCIGIATGQERWKYRHPGPFGFAFLRGGSRIVVNGWSCIYLDTATGQEIMATPKLTYSCRLVAASPADDRFVRLERVGKTGSKPFLVAHEAEEGRELWRTPIEGWVAGLAYSADGRMIAVGGLSIRLFDAEDGRLMSEFGRGEAMLTGVTFSPDGKHLVAARGGRLHTFDIATGNLVGSPTPTIDPPGVGTTSVAWSADSTRVVTAGLDGGVFIFDAATGQLLQTVRSDATEVRRVVLDDRGERVLSMDGTGLLTTHDLATGKSSDAGKVDRFAAIAFCGGQPAGLSRVEEGGLGLTVEGRQHPIPGSTWGAQSTDFSRDGSLIAVIRAGRRVRIWDAATRTAKDPAVAFTANHMTFSPDGGFLAVHDGGPIRIHDVVTGESRFEIEVLSGSSHIPLALSPGAKLLAFSGRTPVIELWSVAREKRCTRLTGHSGKIQELSFSPDGTRLLSRSKDGTILIWDVSAWD